MNEDQEKIVLENENLIYMVLKKYHLYDKREDYYDLGVIGLVKGAKTYDSSKSRLSTYLTKCITNELLQYLRKKRPYTLSYENMLVDEENLTYEDTLVDVSTNIESEISDKINFEAINTIIKDLPYKEQVIINHLYNINGYEQLSQKGVADLLQISQAQVSRIKDKVIIMIRKKMSIDD